MKATELKLNEVMVGDWVDVRNEAAPNTPHIERITPAHLLRNEQWYGVKLTAEILEKNGIKRDTFGNICGEYFSEDEYGRFEISMEGTNIWWSINFEEYHILKLQYVHELQHALRLCGIEKEITL